MESHGCLLPRRWVIYTVGHMTGMRCHMTRVKCHMTIVISHDWYDVMTSVIYHMTGVRCHTTNVMMSHDLCKTSHDIGCMSHDYSMIVYTRGITYQGFCTPHSLQHNPAMPLRLSSQPSTSRFFSQSEPSNLSITTT